MKLEAGGDGLDPAEQEGIGAVPRTLTCRSRMWLHDGSPHHVYYSSTLISFSLSKTHSLSSNNSCHSISSACDLDRCLTRLLIPLIKSKQWALVSYILQSWLPLRNNLQMESRRSPQSLQYTAHSAERFSLIEKLIFAPFPQNNVQKLFEPRKVLTVHLNMATGWKKGLWEIHLAYFFQMSGKMKWEAIKNDLQRLC